MAMPPTVVPALSRNPGAGDVDSRPVSGYGAGSARKDDEGALQAISYQMTIV